MSELAGNGEAMARLRCATIGVVASIATTTVFIAGIILLFKYSDVMVNSVPRPR